MAARQPAPKKIRAPREDVVKSASISIDGKDQTLSCTIRDISTTGAKISVANAATVNPRVLLLCRGADLVALADIVWRSSHEIGVHFIRRGGFHLEAEFRARQAETYHSQQESAGAQQQQQAKTQTAFIAQQEAISMQAHFKIMGLDPTLDYTAEQLKYRYRLLAMRAHPDQGGDAQVFQQLTQAYQILASQAPA